MLHSKKWCPLQEIFHVDSGNNNSNAPTSKFRGGSRIFFRRGCTRLWLYFNNNKPHSFFLAEHQLYKKTAGHLRGGGGVRTPCTLPLDPPLKLTKVQPSLGALDKEKYEQKCVSPVSDQMTAISIFGRGKQDYRHWELNSHYQEPITRSV